MTDELRAIGWSILVIEDRPVEKTGSGIELAQMSRLPPCTGRVFSIGAEAKKEHPEIHVGARLHFKPFGGRAIEWRELKFRVLGREDTLALVENTTTQTP
jgi:co-chaperonin GroES (HSP10)